MGKWLWLKLMWLKTPIITRSQSKLILYKLKKGEMVRSSSTKDISKKINKIIYSMKQSRIAQWSLTKKLQQKRSLESANSISLNHKKRKKSKKKKIKTRTRLSFRLKMQTPQRPAVWSSPQSRDKLSKMKKEISTQWKEKPIQMKKALLQLSKLKKWGTKTDNWSK